MNATAQKTILLVEDEGVIGMLESMELKKCGYNVIHVLNGQRAIDTISNNKDIIDLILMDINLGQGIDGTETAKAILNKHDIPILFLSSHIEREIVEKTELITSYGYVVKDSSITVLDASIKMAFRLHAAHLDLKHQKDEIEAQKKEVQYYEKRYRRLFESAQDGILILNVENGMIIDVNPFLIQMLGYSKEKILEKHIWEINAFKNIDYSKQLFRELQDKEYVRYEDLPLETLDGRQIHVEFVSNVYLVDDERVVQCNIRDITDRRLHEKNLSNNAAANAMLLSELQHRTKNSFNIITSLINLRSNTTDSQETKTALKELTYRVKSISDLYTVLYESGSFTEVQLKTYCHKIIEPLLNLSKNIAIHKNIEEIIISTKCAATIGMILVELLTNAIKHAFPASQPGIIGIEIKKIESKIVICVEDNGIGLPKDFNIINIDTLGLHLINLMVSQLDGTLKFMSEVGTKIIIECPA